MESQKGFHLTYVTMQLCMSGICVSVSDVSFPEPRDNL
jgi:hypothetical protein